MTRGLAAPPPLNRFSLDFIKVDRSLITHLATDEHSQTLADCIVTLAGKFGLKTVAEGIETGEQLAVAGRLGFDLAQGFFLSRPLAAEAVPGVILEGPQADAGEQDPIRR